jgi:predicted enzyme related to lactoylglutathione lyase
MLAKRVEEYAVLARVNVPWLEKAIEWYENTFDLQNDERFYCKGVWAQLNFPNHKRFAIGLSQGAPTPGEGNVITIVVKDIEDACDDLKGRDVVVGPILDEGKGVKLAFFYDPFGNKMAIRQNSKEQPEPNQVGYQD